MFKPSDNFWKLLDYIAGLFVITGTFCLLVFAANVEIRDLDLWLHIGTGRYIVQHWQVPVVDILSCTIAGTIWINHEWLFQVIVYLIHKSWGVDGLLNMQIGLVALTLLILVVLGHNKKNQLISLLGILLVSLVYQSRFTMRPDLYSLFFFASYVMILAMFIQYRWSVIVLVVLQVLWANMHGFFFLGPLIVGLGILGEWLKRHAPLPQGWKTVGRLNNDEYRRMKVLLVMILLACLITPQGIWGAIYPLKVFTQISGDSKVFFEKIVELQKPITWDNLFDLNEWPHYKLLILISFLSFVFNRKKIDVGILLFWLFFLLFSLAAVRNLIFFAFAAYLVLVTNAMTIRFKDIIPVRFTDRKFVYITSIVIKLLMTGWIINYFMNISGNGYFDYERYVRKSEFGGVSLRQYPHQAVDFLVKNKVKGHFYNDFNSGAYLVGHCFPDIKVFIDGRTEVYGPEFFNYYRQIHEKDNPAVLQEAIKRFGITGIFFNSVHSAIPPQVFKSIYNDRAWVPVYFDYDAVIFLKDIAQNREVIRKHRMDLSKWKAKELDLYRLGPKDISPYQHVNRAYSLESLDLDGPATAEAKAGIRLHPGHPGPYKILGKIAGKTKRFEDAYENFRIAVSLSLRDQSARLTMTQALIDLKRYDEAAQQSHRLIEMFPNASGGYIKLAKANVLRKKYQDVVPYIQKGFKSDPGTFEDVLLLTQQLTDHRQYDLALQVYRMVKAQYPKDERVYLRLYQTLALSGKKPEGIKILYDGLEVLPESAKIKEKLRGLGQRVDSQDRGPLLKK